MAPTKNEHCNLVCRMLGGRNAEHHPSMGQLAKERKFDSICTILADKKLASTWLPRNALHILCRYRPTEAVVRKVLSLLSVTCDLEVDARGRTPLHIAAAHGADAAVLRLLLGDATSTAASVLDSNSRYPLHYAGCAVTTKKALGRDHKRVVENSVQTAQLLLEAFPDAVHAQDNRGKIPLDLALAYSKHERFVSTLQLASSILRGAFKQSNNKTNGSGDTETTASATEEESITGSNGSHRSNDVFQFLLPEVEPDLDDLSSVGMRGISFRGAMHTSRQYFARKNAVHASPPEYHDSYSNDDNGYDDDDDLSSIGMHGVSRRWSFFDASHGSLIGYMIVEI